MPVNITRTMNSHCLTESLHALNCLLIADGYIELGKYIHRNFVRIA